MSRYTYEGSDPAQHVTVGWDPARASMFAQLWPHPTEEETSPLFVLGDEEIITDVEWLNTQMASYGAIPQTLRGRLDHDWKHTPPFRQAKELQQFHKELLALAETHSQRFYVSIDALYGVQTRYWRRLPSAERERKMALARLLSTETQPAQAPVLQTLSSTLSDPTIQILVDQHGVLKRLPPVAFIHPDYLLFGTVLLLAPDGLSEYQLRIIEEEVVFLDIDESAREEIQKVFYTQH